MLFLLALLLLFAAPDLQIAEPDSLKAKPGAAVRQQEAARERGELEVRFKLSPKNLWSSRLGFGFGVGLQFRDLFAAGTRLDVTARPSTRRGIYEAALATSDPYRSPLFALARVSYETTGAHGFFGLGPSSHEDDLLLIEREGVETELRLGVQPLRASAGPGRRTLLVQPVARMLWQHVQGFRERRPGALERLDPLSRAHLDAALAGGEARTTLSLGLEAEVDTRDSRAYPTRGFVVEGTAHRFRTLEADPLRFNAFSTSAYAFLPVSGRRVLALRLIAAVTRGGGGGPVPFYFLPVLDRRLMGGYAKERFVGNDLLLATAEYRFPILNLADLYELSGFGLMSAGSVYHDLFDQFSPGLSFRTRLEAGRDRYPLRPAFGFGLRLASIWRDELVLDTLLGVSPEGFQFVSLRFVHDLRDLRPLVVR